MSQKINFNAGPAQLPPEVLHEAAKAVREYKKTGCSIMELPHRGPEALEIIEECNFLVRKLCRLDQEYEVLWLQGGGRMQFCMVPLNFLPPGQSAGYLDTGHWAREAADYAGYYGAVSILASSSASAYDHLPAWPHVPSGLAYVHITTNNTIYGTQWHHIPQVDAPLIADMSSDIFSRETDYSRYALFYAATQKNLGAAGLALVVVRKDMLERINHPVPPMLSYKAQVRENSIVNTINLFGIYTSLLMLRWTDAQGIAGIAAKNQRKAEMLYTAIDNSNMFTAHVQEKTQRSQMNIVFTAKTQALEHQFLDLCSARGIIGIKGHRTVGGFRVSLYNAATVEQVEELVAVMDEMKHAL